MSISRAKVFKFRVKEINRCKVWALSINMTSTSHETWAFVLLNSNFITYFLLNIYILFDIRKFDERQKKIQFVFSSQQGD